MMILFDTKGCESKLAPPRSEQRQNFNYCATTKPPDKASARANVVGAPSQGVPMHPLPPLWAEQGLLRFRAAEVPTLRKQHSFDTDLDEVCRTEHVHTNSSILLLNAAKHALAKRSRHWRRRHQGIHKFSRNTRAPATLETPPPRLSSLEN